MELNKIAELSAQIKHTYQVTPDVYFSFQRCSKDYNPLHTDQAFAKEKGYDSCVMYGNILNAFVSHFVGMVLPSREVMIQSQDISYKKPVFLDDLIEIEGIVETVSEAVNIIEYKLKFRRVKDGSKPELVAAGHVQIGLL